uniref:Uncharacterized protein n=1 Tax=uncultured delta proteobacterium HF0200_19J16 TaxID=710831 RepID=E0XUA3_9DELT|nr:hypothetical protein [uncultured delta proteobacterium HF0200_19J16]
MLRGQFFGIPLRLNEQSVTKLFNNNFQSQILAFGRKNGRQKGWNKL